jgi:hypothetical protein
VALNEDAGAQLPKEEAGQMLGALEAYRRVAERMARQGWEIDDYRAAAALFAQMRGHTGRLPKVGVAWIGFLITRFEFAQALWDQRQQPDPEAALADCYARHADAVAQLEASCMKAYVAD